MATINRLKIPIINLDGLLIKKLENSEEKTRALVIINTVKEIINGFEFDRTFDNIDNIEGLLIDKLENPNETPSVKIDFRLSKANKEYEEEIKVAGNYNEKNKY